MNSAIADTVLPLVAVIDANPQHRQQVATALGTFYRVVEYDDADKAISDICLYSADVVIVDEHAKPRGGFDIIRRLRRDRGRDLPIIFTSRAPEADLRAALERYGADAHLVKPYRRHALLDAVAALVNRRVERQWENLAPTPKAALRGTMDTFSRIAGHFGDGIVVPYQDVTKACEPLVQAIMDSEFRDILAGIREHDNYAYAHSLRVSILLTLLGHTIGLGAGDMRTLASGGLLHDVGKMSIPVELLHKRGVLDEEEVRTMRAHVAASISYLDATPSVPQAVRTIAETHHERIDGSGYPQGLSGGQVDDLSRMVAIVDVFSGLTDRRNYRAQLGTEAAMTVMTKQMRRSLDQHFVSVFRTVLLDSASSLGC